MLYMFEFQAPGRDGAFCARHVALVGKIRALELTPQAWVGFLVLPLGLRP